MQQPNFQYLSSAKLFLELIKNLSTKTIIYSLCGDHWSYIHSRIVSLCPISGFRVSDSSSLTPLNETLPEDVFVLSLFVLTIHLNMINYYKPSYSLFTTTNSNTNKIQTKEIKILCLFQDISSLMFDPSRWLFSYDSFNK